MVFDAEGGFVSAELFILVMPQLNGMQKILPVDGLPIILDENGI